MAKKFLQVGPDGLQEEILGFGTDEFIDSSAGAADAGKPVKLDSNGQIDSSMIDFGAIDHGQLSGLLDDDHTQYIRVDATRCLILKILTIPGYWLAMRMPALPGYLSH